MKLFFSKQIFAWLFNEKILKHPPKQETNEGQLVCYDDAIYFHNGYKIRLILKLLQIEYHLGLHHLPMIRKITVLYEDENWMVIKWETLDKLGIPLSEDEIYNLYNDHTPITRIVNTLYKDFYMTKKFTKKATVTQRVQKQFNIKTFDYGKDPTMSSSSLQFITLLLTKHFQIKVQQGLGMLTNQSQLLARVIIQGTVKDGFDKVNNLFDDLLDNVDTFSSLLESQNNTKYIMNGLRCGFFGGSYDAVEKIIMIVKRASLKDWLIQIDKGRSIFLGLERYPALSQQLLSLISSFFGANLIPLIKQNFSIGIKKDINHFLRYAKQLISFMRSSIHRKQFIQSDILQQILQIVLKTLQPQNIEINARLTGLNLLTQLLLTEDFMKNLRYSTTIKRLFQSAQPLLQSLFSKLALCDNLFKLLQHYIQKHNENNIKLFYHILCSLLRCQVEQVFEFVLENLKIILGKYDTVPIMDFLETSIDLCFSNPVFLSIFTNFLGRTLSQQQLKLIGQIILVKYQDGLEKNRFGYLLISFIKANYQNSEQLIMISVRGLLYIYCNYLVNPCQKIKRPSLKNKDLKQVFNSQEQQNLVKLQFINNTCQILLKLLQIIKQQHHQQIFKQIQQQRLQLKKRKTSGKQLQKFMKALAETLITQQDQEQDQIQQIVKAKRKQQQNKLQKIKNEQIINSSQQQQSDDQNNFVENTEQKQLFVSQFKNQNKIFQEKQLMNNEQSEQVNSQQQKKQQLQDYKLQLDQNNNNQKYSQKSSPKKTPTQRLLSQQISTLLPIHNQQLKSVRKTESSGIQMSERKYQQQFCLKQFTQQPIIVLNPPIGYLLEDHQSVFISYIKQVHKFKFQYLMLLMHQQGIDMFSQVYSLKSFFAKNYDNLAKQLLQKKNIQVGQFAQILIMNSLRSPGVNRMMGIMRMLQHFKKQTIKLKGNIRIFEDNDKGLQKLIEQKDGFKQTKYRSVQYICTIKNRSLPQKYKICYEIINQILLKKFSASSIQHITRISDTIAAEEISQKKQKNKQKTQQSVQINNPHLPANILDQQRKDKITARIRLLQKQSKQKI